MTVCVAAICNDSIVLGASDRMITAGDVEFEPQRTKIWPLTTSINVMIAGDTSLQLEIFYTLRDLVNQRLQEKPHDWIPVKDVAEWYYSSYMTVRNRRTENALLNPLGLDRGSFVSEQRRLNPSLANKLATDLVNYDMPEIQAIISGVDSSGAHIYFASNAGTSCRDSAGFAAIGAGYWHANSQFMFAGHTSAKAFPDTLLLTYAAKRRAEVAPGVGEGTDMFVCGPVLGTFTTVAPHVLESLRQIYEKTRKRASKAQAQASKEVNKYVEELNRASAAAAETATSQQQKEVSKESTTT